MIQYGKADKLKGIVDLVKEKGNKVVADISFGIASVIDDVVPYFTTPSHLFTRTIQVTMTHTSNGLCYVPENENLPVCVEQGRAVTENQPARTSEIALMHTSLLLSTRSTSHFHQSEYIQGQHTIDTNEKVMSTPVLQFPGNDVDAKLEGSHHSLRPIRLLTFVTKTLGVTVAGTNPTAALFKICRPSNIVMCSVPLSSSFGTAGASDSTKMQSTNTLQSTTFATIDALESTAFASTDSPESTVIAITDTPTPINFATTNAPEYTSFATTTDAAEYTSFATTDTPESANFATTDTLKSTSFVTTDTPEATTDTPVSTSFATTNTPTINAPESTSFATTNTPTTNAPESTSFATIDTPLH
ncbi:mucin-5AC-like [Macrobrachium nipponense]|uniref:mucin-5AC-like n=1 Tax=Macrobrachium nipponense TaxID=159736 RepID=UPI0030C83A79